MENDFSKINQQCLNNLYEINNALSAIETKGDSTMTMYKIRVFLSSTLEQIQKDNQQEQQNVMIDNTQDKKK